MLVSIEQVKKYLSALDTTQDSDTICRLILKKLEDSEVIFKTLTLPRILLDDSEKCVTIYCDNELFKFFDSLKGDESTEMDMIGFGKLYLKIKKLLKNVDTVRG